MIKCIIIDDEQHCVDALAAILKHRFSKEVEVIASETDPRKALLLLAKKQPDLLFLDEPTTGLDPQSRRQLWDIIDAFRREGGTTVLTTHYMDEAERLCDRVAIVDHGKVIALGTPRELIGKYVKELGLNPGTFARCSISTAVRRRIMQNDGAAQSLYIRGTPTFFVNGRIIPGAIPLDEFRRILDALLR